MHEPEFTARAAAYVAERSVLDSMPVEDAMEYLAQHPASAHSHAPLLYFESRSAAKLRAELKLILGSMPVEVPAVGDLFMKLKAALD